MLLLSKGGWLGAVRLSTENDFGPWMEADVAYAL